MSEPPRVRIYGHSLGYGSFAQVTRGFVLGLAEHGLFGGFVPLDFYDDEEEYPGSTCRYSINCGMPSGVIHAQAMGAHEHRWLMLAPNSDRVPTEMRQWIPNFVTALLGPSKWAQGVLKQQFPELPVYYVPHGVLPEYCPAPERIKAAREERRKEERAGEFRVLHMTSTNSERKSTKNLLHAWRNARLREGAELTIVCRFKGYAELAELRKDLGLEESVAITHADGQDPETVLERILSAHVVCQPSRAEGFGLVPLEAKACGVPVVMTGCTGHSDHVAEGATVTVVSGPDIAIDDYPGAKAPAVYVDDIRDALEDVEDKYPYLQGKARHAAADIQQRWSWAKTTGEAIRGLVEEQT